MQTNRLFSSKDRPIHYGSYPLHRLKRLDNGPSAVDLASLSTSFLRFERGDDPDSIINAMAGHQAMLDAIRDGLVNKARADIPDDLEARAQHLKSFGYFCDASLVGIGKIDEAIWLDKPVHNDDVDDLITQLRTRQTKTLAAGIDVIMADLKESVEAPPRGVTHHKSALVFLFEYHRDPYEGEEGTGWLYDAQAHRGGLLSAETAIVIANYIRLLGFDAKAHTLSASDICLQKAALCAGLGVVHDGALEVP